ncbi:MAG: single-stranded DNA-binding protein [Candidatus Woesearchaeota archaeon]
MANPNNCIVLQGRLAHEPDLRYIGEYNTPALTFDLIVYDYYSKSDKEEKNQKIRVKKFGNGADNIAENIMVGQQIQVLGSLKIDSRDKGKGFYPWVRADIIRLGMKPLGYYKNKWKNEKT